MKRLVYIAAAVLVALWVGVVLLRATVTTESVRRSAIERIETLTGYETEVHGQTRLTLFPQLGFEIADIVLERSRGRLENEVASIAVLRGTVALMPLIFGEVYVEDLVLVRPMLRLSVDRHGRGDWGPLRGTLGAAAAGEQLDSQTAAGHRIGAVRIENGAVAFVDQRNDRRIEAAAINGSVSWATLAGAMKLEAGMVWNGEPVAIAVDLADPLELLRRGSSPARLLIDSHLVRATFEGRAGNAAGPQLEGKLTLATPSARRLLAWFGTDVGGRDPDTGMEPGELNLAGTLSLAGGSAGISGLEMTLDGNRAEGGIKLGTSADGLTLQGTLAFETLDISGKFAAAEAAGEAAGEEESAAPVSLMATTLDLSRLAGLTSDVRFSAATVLMGPVQASDVAGTVTVRNGTLDVGIGAAALFGGTGMGNLTIAPAPEGAGKGVTARLSMKLDAVGIAPLLAVVPGADRFTGNGSATVSLGGTGRTPGEIVSGLSGQARIAIAGGAIVGLDVAALIDTLGSGRVDGWPSSADARTEFSRMAADFTVSQGTAATENFTLEGATLSVAADGEIRLLPLSVAAHGTADLGPAVSDGSAAVADRLEVPFVIEGPMDRPSIYPDPLWLLQRAQMSPEELDRVRSDLVQKKPEDVVEELLQHGLRRGPDPRPAGAANQPEQ